MTEQTLSAQMLLWEVCSQTEVNWVQVSCEWAGHEDVSQRTGLLAQDFDWFVQEWVRRDDS